MARAPLIERVRRFWRGFVDGLGLGPLWRWLARGGKR